jgi:hypothetical protein
MKQKGGSAVVRTPAPAAIRRQLVVTKPWRNVRCRARQVQVVGWSGSPKRTVVPQSHQRAGVFAGPAGRPRRMRADDTKSESDRVNVKELGMESNQMEAGNVSVFINLQRETEEKTHQPETKLSAIAQTRHIARLRDAKRSRTRNPKPTHGAQDRPKQPQPRAGYLVI